MRKLQKSNEFCNLFQNIPKYTKKRNEMSFFGDTFKSNSPFESASNIIKQKKKNTGLFNK